jgi:penicillin-binding protein 1B
VAKKPGRIRSFLWRHSFGIAVLVMVLFVAALGYIGYNYVLITEKFDSSRRWDLPSRIYSDATPILPGLTYPRAILEPKLNHVGYHETARAIENPGEYRYVDGDLEIYLQNFSYPDMDFRAMPVRVEMDGNTVRKIVRLSDGISLRGARLEPELITSIYDEVMEDRVPVPLKAVPKHLIDAIVATEDRAFFRHEGISLRGIFRAAVQNVRAGGVVAGGSTLTQQLVKNLYLTAEREWARKIREAIMAVILDARYSKEDILEAYLNEIYLGQNGSVQVAGVEQAAQVYFSKHVRYLTLPEAATIAGIIRSPNSYTPLKYPERARERRDLVLSLMRDQNMITPEQYQAAIDTPLRTSKYPRSFRSAPYFVDLVMQQLRETYPETQLKTEGLRIFTTLDTMMQRSAERALDQGVERLRKQYAAVRNSKTPLEGVVISIQPGTGYVRALVGGRNYSRSQFNRALQAKRQPGSLFKPFVYIAAMDPARGDAVLTASSILADTPITVQTGSTVWRPQNYDGKFHGTPTVRRALAHSYNIPAVRAAIEAGVPNVIRLASKIGVESRLEPYPSISLGSFEVTPLEIAYAYSVFANEGVKAEPISILGVVTKEGKVLESRNVQMKRVAPASLTYVMNDILQDVLEYGTAGGIRSRGFKRPFAGKTGTTNDYRDAWFIGYSPRILSLVWLGYDDNHSIRLAGSDAAVPIWTSYMNSVIGTVPDVDFRRPDSVVERDIDPESGLLATPYCTRTIQEIYVQGTEPDETCTIHSGGFDSNYPWYRRDQPERPVTREDTSPSEERPAEPEPERPRRKRRWWEKIFGD